MSTTVKIMLNDESSVTEIAKDPAVVLKIKNAILDGISKRVAKSIQGEIEIAVKNEVYNFTHSIEKNEVFARTHSWNGPLLSDKTKKMVHDSVMRRVSQEIESFIDSSDANIQLREAFESRKKQIESYDFDAAIKKCIKDKVNSSFAKIVMEAGNE